MPAPSDRYEPLPGLIGLPGHFLRKLSPRGRKFAAVIGLVLVAAAVAGVIVLAPRVQESRRERAAADHAAQVRLSRQAHAQILAGQRPRFGRVELGTAGGTATLITRIEAAITRDTRARVAEGELESRARRTSCRRLGRQGRRLLLACTAVTSDLRATDDTPGVVVGYSYQAAVSTSTGHFAFCKASSRPLGTSSPQELRALRLPRVCRS